MQQYDPRRKEDRSSAEDLAEQIVRGEEAAANADDFDALTQQLKDLEASLKMPEFEAMGAIDLEKNLVARVYLERKAGNPRAVACAGFSADAALAVVADKSEAYKIASLAEVHENGYAAKTSEVDFGRKLNSCKSVSLDALGKSVAIVALDSSGGASLEVYSTEKKNWLGWPKCLADLSPASGEKLAGCSEGGAQALLIKHGNVLSVQRLLRDGEPVKRVEEFIYPCGLPIEEASVGSSGLKFVARIKGGSPGEPHGIYRLLEAGSGKELKESAQLELNGTVSRQATSPDTGLVAAAIKSTNKVAILDLLAGRSGEIDCGGEVTSMALDAHGSHLAVGLPDKTVKVYSLDRLGPGAAREVATYVSPDWITALSFSRDGTMLLVGDITGKAMVFGKARA